MIVADMDFIEARSIPVPEAGCWIWTEQYTTTGYGSVAMGERGKKGKAHRLAWSAKNGPIPAGMLICHKCDTRGCVNPDHLYAGTPRDNSQDLLRNGGYLGTNNGRSAVTEREVLEIRDLESVMSQATIGGHYGISQRAVSHICRRKSWAHV